MSQVGTWAIIAIVQFQKIHRATHNEILFTTRRKPNNIPIVIPTTHLTIHLYST